MNNEDTDFNEPSARGNRRHASRGRARRPSTARLLAARRRRTDDPRVRGRLRGRRRRPSGLDAAERALGRRSAAGLRERFARKGKRLRNLEERGWTEEPGDGTWVLTDEGRAAKERLGAIVDGIRSRVAGAVSPEDFATTMASLEAIARELGWDESVTDAAPRLRPRTRLRSRSRFRSRISVRARLRSRVPSRFRSGRGLRSRVGRGFGPSHCGGAHCDPAEHGLITTVLITGTAAHHRRHHEGGSRGHGERSGRSAQRAYERGFDAGFSRGRSATRRMPRPTRSDTG